MLFDEAQKTVTVYRQVVPTGNTLLYDGSEQYNDGILNYDGNETEYVDPVWSGMWDIQARFEPMSIYDRVQNQQRFPNVTEYCFVPIEYLGKVEPDDCLKDASGVVRQIRGEPVIWDVFFPRIECQVERVQFDV